MSTIIEQSEEFHRFVMEQSREGQANLTLDDLFQQWRAATPSEEELKQSLESLDRGLKDAEAGRLIDADDAISDTRTRLQQQL